MFNSCFRVQHPSFKANFGISTAQKNETQEVWEKKLLHESSSFGWFLSSKNLKKFIPTAVREGVLLF